MSTPLTPSVSVFCSQVGVPDLDVLGLYGETLG